MDFEPTEKLLYKKRQVLGNLTQKTDEIRTA